MPELDGYEATNALRADDRFQDLTIIAMTAHAMNDERQRCLDCGMNAHLAKPIEPHSLFTTISQWCPTHVVSAAAEVVVNEAANSSNQLQIEGLDTQEGLKRTLGNHELYFELLARFCDDQRDAVVKAQAAFVDGDAGLAERLIHTLKGVAALIAAKDVRYLAEELESFLRNSNQARDIISRFDTCQKQLQLTISSIENAVLNAKTTPLPESAPNINPVYERSLLQAKLTQCETLLAESDGEALDILVEASDLIVQALGVESHKQVMRAAKQFDFDGALDYLRQGAKSHGYQINLHSIG